MAHITHDAHRANAPRLVPAFQASKLMVCSAFTLARMAAAGKITAYRSPGRTCRFYDLNELEPLMPKPIAAKRSAKR